MSIVAAGGVSLVGARASARAIIVSALVSIDVLNMMVYSSDGAEAQVGAMHRFRVMT
jgi:hypothetical protein